MSTLFKSNLALFVERLCSRSVLSQEEQDAIHSLPAHASQIDAHFDFVRLGETVAYSTFVLDGLVGRFDQIGSGSRQITALHIPGDMTDLHSVVAPTATSALEALTTSTILKIPHTALRAVARKYPAVAEAFWRDEAVNSMILAQWVVNVGCRAAKSSLAHLLCEMACRYKVEADAGTFRFQFPMTQSQLGDALGLTSVHINRTLGVLGGIGTSFKGQTVCIEDWDKLCALGDFDRGYLQENIRPAQMLAR